MGAASVEELVQAWVEQTRNQLAALKGASLEGFVARQARVLGVAGQDAAGVAWRLAALAAHALGHTLSHPATLARFREAASVDVDGVPVFLPTSRDDWMATAARPERSLWSPFRAIAYSWFLGEAAHAFEQARASRLARKSALHHERGRSLVQQLDAFLAEDDPVSKREAYAGHLATLRAAARRPAEAPSELKRSVELLKAALQPAGPTWADRLPHISPTSTHFYLAGIRFYWRLANPALERDWENYWYCVHSTDSGLVVPAERYGMLLGTPDGSLDSAEEETLVRRLVQELPPGSLALDLGNPNATDDDLKSLIRFETWSRLLGDRAREITRSMLTRDENPNSAIDTFLAAVSKNPIRTFYFDCGLWGAARRASAGHLPRIQYMTTRQTRAGGGQDDPGRELFDAFLASCGDGIEFYLGKQPRWPVQGLGAWTLAVRGPDIDVLRCVCSTRNDVTGKIAHGREGSLWQNLLYRARNEFRVDRHALLALVGAADAAIAGPLQPAAVPAVLLSVGHLLELATATRLTLKERADVITAMNQVDDRYYWRIQSADDPRLSRS